MRLMPEGLLQVPVRKQSDGMWDWYYQLSPADRRRVLRHCKPGGEAPDQCARQSGFEYVDEWAGELVAAIQADAKPEPVSNPYTVLVSPADLVGPVEIGDMLNIKPATVYVWVNRGRLPAPVATISGTRLWVRSDIDQWADENRKHTETDALEPF